MNKVSQTNSTSSSEKQPVDHLASHSFCLCYQLAVLKKEAHLLTPINSEHKKKRETIGAA